MDTEGVTCTNGVHLTTVTNKTCTVKCKDGYTHDSGNATYTCQASGGDPTTDLVCTENTCTIPSFGTGVQAGASDPCEVSGTLNAVTDNECSIACMDGYTQTSGNATYTCPIGGGDPTTTLVCTEIQCDAVTLSSIDGLISNSSSDGCVEDQVLTTIQNNSCSIQCDVSSCLLYTSPSPRD